jgi:hypothetical protein
MPPKGSKRDAALPALPVWPALQHKGTLSPEVSGIIFALREVGYTFETISKAVGVSPAGCYYQHGRVHALCTDTTDAGNKPEAGGEHSPTRAQPRPEDDDISPSRRQRDVTGLLDRKTSSGEVMFPNARAVRDHLLSFKRYAGQRISVRVIQRDMQATGHIWKKRPKTALLNIERMAKRLEMIPRLRRFDIEKVVFSDVERRGALGRHC